MHLIEHKKGYLCGAANREGESYTDWRAPYIDRSGLLMIYESNSRSGNHVFRFRSGRCHESRHEQRREMHLRSERFKRGQ